MIINEKNTVKIQAEIKLENDVYYHLKDVFKKGVKMAELAEKNSSSSSNTLRSGKANFELCLKVLLEAKDEKTITFNQSLFISIALPNLLRIFNVDVVDWASGKGDSVSVRDAVEYRKEIAYVFSELAHTQSEIIFEHLMKKEGE